MLKKKTAGIQRVASHLYLFASKTKIRRLIICERYGPNTGKIS